MAKHLLYYLKGTKELGILFSGRLLLDPRIYKIFTDAIWGTEDDRVSFQGMAIAKYGGVTSWYAQRQRSTTLSSMEAEVIVASEGEKQSVWLGKLATDLGEWSDSEQFVPTLYCDNVGAVELLYDTKFHRKAKHIELQYMYLRNDLVGKGKLMVEHIPRKDQPADIFTKQLPIEGFNRHCATLGLVKSFN
jgi:hypothetical protein